jgi:hypothetical protein
MARSCGSPTVIVAGDMAVVELVTDAIARNGMHFDNHYGCVSRFGGKTIVEVCVPTSIPQWLPSSSARTRFDSNPPTGPPPGMTT